MPVQTVFKRYELKYILTQEQKKTILETMADYMTLDQYGRTNIRNIYYDTDTYLLVRRSIEKPIYKEKLRVRSYGRVSDDQKVFVELKKKYDGIVYKRRISLESKKAYRWINERENCVESTQIVNEINYFMNYYKNLRPVIYLSYEREAYYAKDGSEFRVTFDDHILCRQENLSLASDNEGTLILPKDLVLMELKCPGAIPMWMTKLLSQEKIYKQSFSKYGTAYKLFVKPLLDYKKI